MFETSAARRQDQKNRQNSIDDLPEQVQIEWRAMQEQLLSVSSEMYGRALGLGIAKECARKVLPEGLTVSVLYMAGSLRSWIHYLDQRCDPSTQLEHRQVAESIKAILAQEIPEIFQ
jgi:thymidylate synthase (FAD)